MGDRKLAAQKLKAGGGGFSMGGFGLDEGLMLGGTLLKSVLGKSNADYLAEHQASLQNRASQTGLADVAARLPLRGMTIDRILGMDQMGRENLNSLFADEGNPYSRPLDRPQAALPPVNAPTNGNTVGQQYADDVRHRGQLPTGQPGDFRTNDLEQRAAYTGPSLSHASGVMGVAQAALAEQARKKLADQASHRAALPAGGYYG